MSEQLTKRKERLNKFLRWLQAQKRPDNQIEDLRRWFFDNYAMNEKSINEAIRQLLDYGYVHIKDLYFYVNPHKKQLL